MCEHWAGMPTLALYPRFLCDESTAPRGRAEAYTTGNPAASSPAQGQVRHPTGALPAFPTCDQPNMPSNVCPLDSSLRKAEKVDSCLLFEFLVPWVPFVLLFFQYVFWTRIASRFSATNYLKLELICPQTAVLFY